jgi:putative hydrolase of the HAD superfamily
MKQYTHIFFDLDNTLWDFESNSRDTLLELFEKHGLHKLVPSFEFFHEKYVERNAILWEQYRMNKIDKETLRGKRFEFTFWDMGLDPELVPPGLAHDYSMKGPRKTKLFPEAKETLQYLSSKYRMHIITNGFEEVQHIKLKSSGIHHFFENIITSDEVGYKKPDLKIFEHALEATSSKANEVIMIGDGLEVDVAGARNAGWDTVFFNPLKMEHHQHVTFEISSLEELRAFL